MHGVDDQSGLDRDEGPEPKRWRARGRHRRWRRIAGAIGLVLAAAVAWSYTGALTAPGSDSVGARTAEWFRANHLGAVVNWAEHISYALNPPRRGGTPAAAAQPAAVTSPSDPTSAPATSTGDAGTAAPAPMAAPPPAPSTTSLPVQREPAPMASPASPALAGEGDWTPIGPTIGGASGAYVTEIRPDSIHTSYLDAVVWLDPHRLSFRQFPGAFLPGAPWDRPALVPATERPALVAAFEGGFRPADSRGGVMIGGRVLLPLRSGAATIAIKADGTVDVGRLGTDINVDNGYDSLRQNLDLIVDEGAPVPQLASDPNRVWGFTGPRNNEFVWRSGVGVTASGDVVWVGGPALSITDLAETLARAGAVRAMQLDINHEWVQFNTYGVGADGAVHGTKLLSAMAHTNDRYLTTDSRDFIAVFARPTPLP